MSSTTKKYSHNNWNVAIERAKTPKEYSEIEHLIAHLVKGNFYAAMCNILKLK
jgi:hypothetical protein